MARLGDETALDGLAASHCAGAGDADGDTDGGGDGGAMALGVGEGAAAGSARTEPPALLGLSVGTRPAEPP